MSKFKSSLPAVIVILLTTVFAYFGLQESFFEQDEWHSFGYYNHLLSLGRSELFRNILSSSPLSHFTPLSLFFKMGLYQLFGLNASAYFAVSILLHALVALSIYFLALQLLKKKLPAFVGGLFFAINSSHYQTVTWLGTFEGAELSTLFGVASLLGFLLFLDSRRKRFFVFSLSSILTALLFKETALTFLLLLVVLVVLKESRESRVYTLLKLGGVTLLYILLRSSYLIFGLRGSEVTGGQAPVNMFLTVGYNIVSLPVKIFSQILLPNEAIVNWTNKAITPFELYQHFGRGPWVLENALRYDFVMIPVGLLILLILFLVSKRSDFKLPFCLGILTIFFALLPFLILRKYLVYFDSRYLYTATVGFSLILSAITANLMTGRNLARMRLAKSGVSLAVILIIFTAHLIALKGTISNHIGLGTLRKQILSRIAYENPKLPKKVMFYTKSDTTYYGISDQEKILPFQSGFGQTLLVYFQQDERYPEELFRDFFLWGIDEQGYMESGDRGFGYYRDLDLLKKDIKQYNVPTSSVIAYAWEGENRILINISKEIRFILENSK